MAHELEFVNGEASIAYANEVPWHGLGTKVPSDLTPEQMLVAAKLDWEVNKVPSYIDFNGEKIPTGRQALIRDRDGKILDMVTDDWNPVQNAEAFAFFDDFIKAGDMSMEVAGSLHDGQMTWALAKVSDSFEILGGRDRVDSYLLFSNPHKYGSSINIRMTPTRVVCQNTLTLSMKQKSVNEIKLTHRTKFDADRVKEVLGITHDKMTKYKEMAEFLSTRRYTQDSVMEYFRSLFPGTKESGLNRNGELIMDQVLHEQAGAELGEGTFWSAYNAVTYFTNHMASRTQSTRLSSLWYGGSKDLNIRALEKAVEMANA